MDGEYSYIDLIKKCLFFLNQVKNDWKRFFIFCFTTALLGVLIAWFSPVTYSTNLSFVVEEGKSSSTSGLSALAGQFGFDMSSVTGGSNMLAGDNIIGLVSSRRIIEKALLSSYDKNNKKSLADVYAEKYKLKEKWDKKFKTSINFPVQESRQGFSYRQDSLLQIIETFIMKEQLSVIRKDKKMSFINVSSTMKDELLTKLFTERLVEEATSFYIETKTRRQRANVDRLQNRADSIARLLNIKTFSTASVQSTILDVNPLFKTELVDAEVSARDKLMLGTIYAEVVKNLEIQKATLTQETPVIQVVDAALLPLKKNKTSKLISLIIGGIFGGFIYIGWKFIIQFKKKIKIALKAN
jgi:hypothetical protein